MVFFVYSYVRKFEEMDKRILIFQPWGIGDVLMTLPMIKLILANTFHLYLRPGDELVKKA